MKYFIFIFVLLSANLDAGPIDALEFKDAAQEKRYFNLIEELRCLKCQNSNIAGSNADLAKDLRNKVYDMIVKRGLSDDEIKNWMLARYGDFVLYKPPVKTTTYLLWGLPFILGLIALFVLLYKLKASRKVKEVSLSDEQKLKLKEALKDT